MSDFENQYKSPETPIVPDKAQSAGNLSEIMLRHLRTASPWLRFAGVIGFIFVGLTIFGVVLSLVSTRNSVFMTELNDFPLWLIMPINIVGGLAMAALFFFPAFFIYNFGEKIRKFGYSNSDEDLELAFKYNKSYWKFYGIMTIICLSLIPLFIIISIIAGIALASGLIN
jgi:hypothetical protein